MTMTRMPGTAPARKGNDPGRRASGMRITGFSIRLTTGHALILSGDGALAGVLTPADLARAAQVGALYRGRRAR
jgi:hypothetical protein